MDKPIIQLTNYIPHPTNKEYVVFMFHNTEMANYFRELLEREHIKYEMSEDEENRRPRILYAVRRSKMTEVLPLNFEAYGKYRKPMLSNWAFRSFLFILVIVVVGMAIYGYIQSS